MQFICLACLLYLSQSSQLHMPVRAVHTLAPKAEVDVVLDITYLESTKADPVKHKLDLYLPPGRKDFPTLLFIHGGGWSHGDKKFWFDLYGRLGKSFAGEGVGVAVVNYRLAPGSKHPDQATDVAQAIAWVNKNISKYGGKPDQLYLAGHSAGGHLVALVSSNQQYLKDAGASPSAIKGVIPISGVYDVSPNELLFSMVFGKEPAVRQDASPITHVKPGLPPFLIVHGDHELPHCDGPCASRFHTKLKENQNVCRLLPIANRDHMSIIARIIDTSDPGHVAMISFIKTAKP